MTIALYSTKLQIKIDSTKFKVNYLQKNLRLTPKLPRHPGLTNPIPLSPRRGKSTTIETLTAETPDEMPQKHRMSCIIYLETLSLH